MEREFVALKHIKEMSQEEREFLDGEGFGFGYFDPKENQFVARIIKNDGG